MRAPRIAATAAAATLAAGLLALAPASPAAAQTPPGGNDTPVAVTGDFVGDEAEELFVYWPGAAGPDQLVSFGRDGSGAVVTRKQRFAVGGVYQPVAGDFDGNGKDELLWYGFGAAADYVWTFTGPASVASRPITVGGAYTPLAGDFTADGADDVLWYGPGGWPDHVWEHDPGGALHQVATNVGGYYQPVVGSFGTDATDDVLWYAYVPAEADHLWDFRPAATPTPASRPLPVNGHYQPAALDMRGQGAGGADIVWYGFGTDRDYVWDFAGGIPTSTPETVNGYYFPIMAGDLFGDGADDLLWFTEQYPNVARTLNVWEHTVAGGTLARNRYALGAAAWMT